MSTIITFYSYKGGVGRTMALANIAVLLAQKGLRVLAVDWDLEAPGLDRYFDKFIKEQPPELNIGLLDLLRDASASAIERPPDWRHYVSQLQVEGSHPLTLLRSGRHDKEYVGKVLTFDWDAFFKHHKGGEFLESLRGQWRENFDVTLVDSRTGITDSGGICTIQMPDVLVLVFSANEQSLLGVKDIAERAQRGRQMLAYDRMPLLVFPLLSRFDSTTEFEEGQKWLKRFAEVLEPFYADWLPRPYVPLQVLEKTKLPYVAYFSFGEKLPVLDYSTLAPEGLGHAYETVATLIADEFKGVERLIGGDIITHLDALRWAGYEGSLLAAGATKALGDVYLKLGEYKAAEHYDKAHQYYEQARQLFHQQEDKAGEAECHQLIGTIYLRSARFNEAEQWYQSALKLYKEVGNKAREADCFKSLGDWSFMASDYQVADEQYYIAQQMYENNGDVLGKAECLRARGDVFRERADFENARKQYNEAFSLYQKASNKFGEARCILSLGHLYMDQSAFDSAISLYEAALEHFQQKEIGDRLWEANSIKSMGDAYRRLGELGDARTNYEKALGIYVEIGNKAAIANCQESLGHLHMRLAEYAKAQQQYEEILRFYTCTSKNKQSEADCRKSLGDALWHQGKYEEARHCFREALSTYQEIGGAKEGEANCYKSIGDMHKARTEYKAAKESYEQALGLYKDTHDKRRTANCLKDMGDISMGLKEIEIAREQYETAMSFYEQVEVKEETANCLEALGELHRKLGETEMAQSRYQRAIELYREIGNTQAESACQQAMLQLSDS